MVHMTQMTLSLYRPVIRARPRTYTPYTVELSFASFFFVFKTLSIANGRAELDPDTNPMNH